jgi:hypothetical protein
MTRRNKEQTAHEIRKLEQELENLERSYAAFERGALWAQKAFFVFIAALLALVLWGVVVALLPLIVVFGIWYFQRPRWIDVVSGGLGKEHPDEKSGAEVLEAQILQWKARLAVLRGERSAEAGGAGIGQAARLIPPYPSGSGTLGHSGNGGVYRMSQDPLLIITAIIVVALLGFLLVQKYNDCMERGGKACPQFCDDAGKNCRLPYGAPEGRSGGAQEDQG